jgi:N-acetylglutamate synthase-like GNAT family acetyltransferase
LEISIKEITAASPEYHELISFRNRLLRLPLGMNLFDEDLSDDLDDFIIIAEKENKIAGCVMMDPKENSTIKLRQMAVDEDLQGTGVGRLLIIAAEEKAKLSGFNKIILHARMNAKGFYEKLGYLPCGELFTEVTIPHIAMQKVL